MKIKGKNYKKRSEFQLKKWIDGNSIHNNIDGECCPDFSCCQPDLLISKEERIIFRDSSDEVRMSLLMGYLGSALAKLQTEKEIYIIGG